MNRKSWIRFVLAYMKVYNQDTDSMKEMNDVTFYIFSLDVFQCWTPFNLPSASISAQIWIMDIVSQIPQLWRWTALTTKRRHKSQVLAKSLVSTASSLKSIKHYFQFISHYCCKKKFRDEEEWEEAKARRPFIERLEMELEKIDFHLRVVWLLKFILRHGIMFGWKFECVTRC